MGLVGNTDGTSVGTAEGLREGADVGFGEGEAQALQALVEHPAE